MKTLTSILAGFLSLIGMAQQPQLGMLPNYTITPASAQNFSVGVAYTNTISFFCLVSNKGTTTFNAGTISLMRAVKSGTFMSTPVALTTFTTNALVPGASINVTATDSIKPSEYKVNGNGNTIVVWPIASGALTKDSLSAGPVYVSDPTGIEELDRHKLYIFPNPANHSLWVKPERGVRYVELLIYDMQLKVVMRKPFEEETDLRDLAPGSYIISVLDTEGRRYSSRFVRE